MAAGLKATLPPLLKSYLPEYEPLIRPSPGKAETKSTIASKSVINADDDNLSAAKSPSQQTSKDGRRHTKGQGSDTVSRSKHPANKSPSRERTLDALKRKQKHFGQKFDDWQQVKQEARDEQERHLHAKIVLQRELIHAQDEYIQKKQREREMETVRLLQEEKAKKRKINSLLQTICQQSLNEDRQRLEDRIARRNNKKTSLSSISGRKGSDSIYRLSCENLAKVQQTPETDKYPGTVTSSTSSRSSIGSTHVAHKMSPQGSPLQEENESDDDEEMEEEADRPWYVEQLYQLFGAEADDFLHPKMKQESKMMDLPMARQRSNDDRGAGGLWTLLREDSYIRLMHEDSNISKELKSAYSAFIRQCLVHRKKPVERNFCAEADVPDLQRLMDHTRIREAQNFSHKVELMYRASRNNKDRSLILMHNNPVTELPLGITEGDEGVAQYLPALTDEDSLDNEGDSMYVYKKWLQPERPHSSTHKPGAPKQPWTERSNTDWQFLAPDRGEARKETRTPRIKFLRERDIRCRGEFSDQMKAKFDKDEVVMVKLPPKPGLAASGGEDSRSWTSQLAGRAMGSQTAREAPSSRDAHHKSRRAQSEMTHIYNDTTLWEPLTLSALMEYKNMRDVFGTGDFARGKVSMWPVKTN